MKTPDPSPAGPELCRSAGRLRRDGSNSLPEPKHRSILRLALRVLGEPMVLLLILAADIYPVIGDAREASLLGGFVTVVVAMTLYH